MDYLPITFQHRESGTSHSPTPMRELLKSLLHEELGIPHSEQQAPLKWTQSFQLHHHFHPGEVKVYVKDGVLRVHARHMRGEDGENCDIRESMRCVQLPDNIDRSRLHCHSHGHRLQVEAPYTAVRSGPEEEEIAIEDSEDDITVPESSGFRQDVDLSVFRPEHISARRRGREVAISADNSVDEGGVKVSRSFHREFKIPPDAIPEELRCRRNSKGLLVFWAPVHEDRK